MLCRELDSNSGKLSRIYCLLRVEEHEPSTIRLIKVAEMNMHELGPEADLSYESVHSVSPISSPTSSYRPAAPGVVEDGQLTARVATTIEEVERLRPLWSAWPHCLDTDLDYYLYNLRNDSTVLRPYVITVYDERGPQAMLLGRVRKRRMSATIAGLHIPGPKAEVLEIANGGRLGCQSSGIDKLLVSALLNAIQRGDMDVLCFRRLPMDSDLLHELGKNLKARVSKVFCCSVLPLAAAAGAPPSTFSGKAKRELRRKTRILQNAFPRQNQLQVLFSLQRSRERHWRRHKGLSHHVAVLLRLQILEYASNPQ